jgi:membrane protein YqaA with SNARE-associated domain
MIFKKLHELTGSYIKLLQRYADRFWFPPLLGLLALLDNLIIVIPNEGILISSSMVIPKRWVIFATSVAIGSTMGALLIVGIVKLEGLPIILKFFPAINETHLWSLTLKFFVQYGLLLIFVVGLTPFSQQPAVILAGLADTSFSKLVMAIFFSRLIKFSLMAYIATHAPRYLMKFWGIKKELIEVGVNLKIEESVKTK